MKILFTFFFLSLTCLALSIELDERLNIYQQIEDITNPTENDYYLIQEYLINGKRVELRRLKDYEYVCRNFKMIGDSFAEWPRFEIIPVNSTLEEKENCILIYSSFNRNYPKGLERLVECIQKSDFKGHILSRLGGWPNLEGGSLILAHVPYAFKVCFFKEADSLGYKKAFWLDVSFIPLVSLNEIFQIIENKGFFVMGNTHMVGPFMNPLAASAFGLTLEQTYHIPSCSSGVFGVDFTTELGKEIIDRWYAAAQDNQSFFSARPDQNALSIILYKLGISDFVPISRIPHAEIGEVIKPDSLLLLDRLFVHHK